MFAFGVRFSGMSISGALLMLGCVPASVLAGGCDEQRCLTTPLENVVVNDGSTFSVGTGGILTGSSVSSGSIQVWDQGVAIGTTIDNAGWLVLRDYGSAFSSTLNNGNLVIADSATALETTVNGGQFDVAQQAAVSDTRLNGGEMWVYADAVAKNTRINNSLMTVYQNGSADRTTVNEGGTFSVNDTATAIDTVVNQGGVMDITAGTRVQSTTVHQGGLMVLGDRAIASETTLDSGSLLQLKGDGTLGRTSHIDGQVAFADPAINGFHTLTINGPLTGNGSFLMNTDLASLQGDLLKVQGPISDSHMLVVADSGAEPRGAQQALMLVDGNGGSGDFKLYGESVDAGAFRYTLQKEGNDWYLSKPPVNNNPDVTPVTPEIPETPQTPQTPETPVAPVAPVNPPVAEQPETPVAPQPSITPPPVRQPDVPQPQTLSKGANAAIASQSASAALIGAHMNATTGHFGDLRSGKDQGGLWVRGYGTEQRLDTGTSRAFKQHVNGMEIGADKALSFANGTLYVGGLLGKGNAHQQFGEASKGTIDSATIGGYASYQDRSGVYVDGALKYSRLNNDIDITSNLGDKVKATFDTHAVSADAQVGKTIDLSRGWFVEPQVGLQMARISGGSYTASNDLTVEQDSMTSVQSRVGGVFGRNVKLDNGVTIKPYAKAMWITEHAGDSHVNVNGARLDSRLPGSRAELGGGVVVSAADKHNFYVEASYTKGSDIEQPWAATVGYRYSW